MCRWKAVKLSQKVPLFPVVLSNTTPKPQRKIAFIGRTWSLHPQLLPFLSRFVSRLNETCRCNRSCDHCLRLRYLSNDSVCTFVLVLWLFFFSWVLLSSEVFWLSKCRWIVNQRFVILSRIIVTQTACMHHPTHISQKNGTLSMKLLITPQQSHHTL